MESALDARRAADRRRQGRRRLGVDDPADPGRRRRGRGRRAGGGAARRCLSCPRSRPSPGTSGRGSSGRRSSAPAAPGRGRSGPTTRRRSPADVAGRTVEAVGRRAKLRRRRPVGRRRPDDPPQDDRPAVRRPGVGARRTRTSGSSSSWPTAASCGSATSASSARSGSTRAIRRPASSSPSRAAPRSSPATGRSRSTPAFTLRAFRARLRRRKGRLKPLLLDQAFLAGIGNIYADEALWAARLHPLRSARTLRPADERRLYEAIRSILAEAVERRGSSIDDYTAPDGDGEMQERLNVYQRVGEPCPRCGRPIRRIVIGARATHFCSWCQRLSAADRKAAARILATMTGGPTRVGAAGAGPSWPGTGPSG